MDDISLHFKRDRPAASASTAAPSAAPPAAKRTENVELPPLIRHAQSSEYISSTLTWHPKLQKRRASMSTADLVNPHSVKTWSATNAPPLNSADWNSSTTDMPFHHRTSSAGASKIVTMFHTVRMESESQLQLQKRAEQKSVPEKPTAKTSKKIKMDKSKAFQMDEHRIALEEVVQRYNTSIDPEDPRKSGGLSTTQVKPLQQIHGPNRLSPPKQTPAIVKLLKHFANFFMLLLEAAGVLCFVAYGADSSKDPTNLYLGIVLWVVVTITCLIAFFQERHTDALMASFKNLLPETCRVLRDGAEQKLMAAELVPGDVVLIGLGTKVPADVRVIQCSGLKVDNSSLTGESEPQARKPETQEENPLEAENVCWYGTLVLDGEGIGIVVRTGDATLIGQIANLAADTDSRETTMELEIKNFVFKISVLAISMGLLFFVLGFIIGNYWLQNILFFIGVTVANVPEGLPSTVTACLAVTAKKLGRRNVFVKKLNSVETLGSVTAIASDKTGTLTENRMTASHMWYDGTVYDCAPSAVDPSLPRFSAEAPSCRQLLRAAALCNRATWDAATAEEPDINKRVIFGDASESAFMRLCESLFSVYEMRDANPKVFEIPFNSKDKWQVSIHLEGGADDAPILLAKGAPEIIMKRCKYVMRNGEVVEKSADFEAEFTAAYEGLGARGERVLALSQLALTNERLPKPLEAQSVSQLAMTEGLVFIGLISLLDPPRAAVPHAIAACHTAGIRVIMVTGDHPFTAKAIGEKIGIITSKNCKVIDRERGESPACLQDPAVDAVVLHGNVLGDLTVAEWDMVLSRKEIIFARTSPQQKLIIVENLQRRGEVVAVTGDGVNDSPALKQANIGCAMGIVGSEVAKEAADIILLDDNFASIVAGIEEGRIIFDNLRKSVAYTIAHAMPEVIPFLCYIVFGLPLGINSLLILAVDLGTELAPAISLAHEPAEPGIMERKPRNVKTDRLVTAPMFAYSYLQIGLLETAAGFACFFFTMHQHGFPASSLVFQRAFFTSSSDSLEAIDTSGKTRTFSRDEQLAAINEAQASWFVAMVVCQVFHIIASKTRVRSVFEQGFKNRTLNIGIFCELAICVLIVYCPGLQTAFSAGNVGWPWLIALPFGLFIFWYNEFRKWHCRTYPNGFAAKYLFW